MNRRAAPKPQICSFDFVGCMGSSHCMQRVHTHAITWAIVDCYPVLLHNCKQLTFLFHLIWFWTIYSCYEEVWVTPWPMAHGWVELNIDPLPAPPPYPCKVSITVYLCTCLFGSGGSFSVAIASTTQTSNHLLFEVRLVYKSVHARVASYVACKRFIALCGVCASLASQPHSVL